jgi:hypothetical protein
MGIIPISTVLWDSVVSPLGVSKKHLQQKKFYTGKKLTSQLK